MYRLHIIPEFTEYIVGQTYPIQKQALSAEYLRDNAHLRARTDAQAATLRLRHLLQMQMYKFFSVRVHSLSVVCRLADPVGTISGARFLLCAYSHSHIQRLRGCGRILPLGRLTRNNFIVDPKQHSGETVFNSVGAFVKRILFQTRIPDSVIPTPP